MHPAGKPVLIAGGGGRHMTLAAAALTQEREIRRLRADIPIVLMSGYSGPELTERAQSAGVSDILRKPLVSRDIAEALARVIPARA